MTDEAQKWKEAVRDIFKLFLDRIDMKKALLDETFLPMAKRAQHPDAIKTEIYADKFILSKLEKILTKHGLSLEDPALCNCDHPVGWHFRSLGSCLECGCLEFKKKKEEKVANAPCEHVWWPEKDYIRCTHCGEPKP